MPNENYHRVPQGNTDANVGTEIEYSASPESETTFRLGGQDSSSIYREFQDDPDAEPWNHRGVRGQVGRDPTAGVEIRNLNPVNPQALYRWYRYSIRRLEEDYMPFEPTGFAPQNSSATSFGLHIHMSPISQSTARGLFELSREPWFRPFVCTSIVEDETDETYQVFRNQYCPMQFSAGPRQTNDCVTLVDDHEDHWEWRMPEPMTVANFGLVMRFLEILYSDGVDAAAEYARHFVSRADEDLTSFRRAEEIGILERLFDDDGEEVVIDRSPHETGGRTSANFFEAAIEEQYAPYIYHVRRNGEHFYVFITDNYDEDLLFEIRDVEVQDGTVVDASNLSTLGNEEADRVENLVREYRQNIEDDQEPRQTDETDVIVEAVEAKRNNETADIQ